jgi:hypothetical protein
LKVLIAPRRRGGRGRRGEKSENPQKGIQSIVGVDDEPLIITTEKKEGRGTEKKRIKIQKLKLGKCLSESLRR